MNQRVLTPDLTVIVIGDPERSRQRAQARGTYSRYHHGETAAGASERERYLEVAEALSARRFPVALIEAGLKPAHQVADKIIHHYLKLPRHPAAA
ncbi:hypothetical protein Ais01nite_74320 [Asanoa ishikariensis]|nr:hypothetical protein Ais01nite_74320 [Asanoa ishikariensis]